MSDTILRNAVIKLAHDVPDLRKHLVPILRKTAGPNYNDYVERKRSKGEKPLSREQWQSKVEGTGEANQPSKLDSSPWFRIHSDEVDLPGNVHLTGDDRDEFAADYYEIRDLDQSDSDRHFALGELIDKYVKKHKPKLTKTYPKDVESVMKKRNLHDEDASELKGFKKSKKSKGHRNSPDELKQQFLQHAKPDTRKRMKDLPVAEFMKMFKAIMDDDTE